MDMNKEITITKNKFLEASANVMASDRMSELIGKHPILLLFAATYSAEVASVLFDKETTESEVKE